MNKHYLWIGIAVILLLLGASLYLNNSRQSQLASQKETTTEPTLAGGAMLEKVGDKTVQPTTQSSDNGLWAGSGSYQTHSPELVKEEQQTGRTVVLFFHAPWCPYCRAADEAFKTNLDKIPQGVSVLKTDYDSNPELRKQYGVTYQHTFVQIDSEGNLVSKWSGGDIENLIKYLK